MITAAQTVHPGLTQLLAGSNKATDLQQAIEPFEEAASNDKLGLLLALNMDLYHSYLAVYILLFFALLY